MILFISHTPTKIIMDEFLDEQEQESTDSEYYGEHEIPDFESHRGEINLPDLKVLLPEYTGLSGGVPMPLGARIAFYFRQFVSLPHAYEQSALLAAICLQPSAMALQQLPVVLLHGDSGTGKSDTIKLLKYFTGFEIQDCTNASLRDTINYARFGAKDGKLSREQNFLLLTDNDDKDGLERNPALYKLLLKGYDRDTDAMAISSGLESNGKPQKTYHVFCAKVISSIFDISIDERFFELRRRTLVLTFKKDKSRRCDNPKNYDFSAIRQEIKDYWKFKPNLQAYRTTSTKVRKAEKAIAPRIGGDANFALYSEYIITMLVFGIVDSLDGAVTIFENHLKRMAEREKSELEQNIEDLLLVDGKYLPKVGIGTLENHLKQAISDGLLEREQKTIANVKSIMKRLGYRKVKTYWVREHDYS